MIHSKQIVCIASTMRSGSTLLKALLAEAPDISNLPEINFQKYSLAKSARTRIEHLDARPIIVLKRPAWYTETKSYPRLPPVAELKVILLVRDVYETVQSCRKMTFRGAQQVAARFSDSWLATKYWARITRSLLALHHRPDLETELVRYEDLVRAPLEETARLFQFVGSQQEMGVDCYQPPADFQWRWGRDDGSPNIRSLRVQPARAKRKTNEWLLRVIERSPAIQELRRHLHYPPMIDLNPSSSG